MINTTTEIAYQFNLNVHLIQTMVSTEQSHCVLLSAYIAEQVGANQRKTSEPLVL